MGIGEESRREEGQLAAGHTPFARERAEQILRWGVRWRDAGLDEAHVAATVEGEQVAQELDAHAAFAHARAHAHLPDEHGVGLARRHVGQDEADDALVLLGDQAGVAEVLAQQDIGVRRVELELAGRSHQLPHVRAIGGRGGAVADVGVARARDTGAARRGRSGAATGRARTAGASRVRHERGFVATAARRCRATAPQGGTGAKRRRGRRKPIRGPTGRGGATDRGAQGRFLFRTHASSIEALHRKATDGPARARAGVRWRATGRGCSVIIRGFTDSGS